jgi:antitoxin component YwqK of YwqJK toxin-antitoxin module
MYRENVKNGESKQYYKSGKLKEEFIYENNVLNGLAKEYEELDGRLITKTVYKNGLIFSKEEINRYDKEGRRVGFWQEYYSFGELKEEGNYVAGLKQGLFKYYNRSGVFEKFLYYEMGQLVQNEEQTKFIEIKKSYDKKGRLNEIGSYRGNVKHGQFKTLDSTGNIISNRLYLNDQLISEGNYDTQGKETGNWKYFYKDGKLRSSGSYVKGKKQGEWKYFFESGEIEQRGKYENGLIEGEWLWYFDNGGLLRKENYKKNKLNGMYEEFTRDSTLVLKGEYIDDYRHDIWYIRTNNTVEEGVYYEGLKNSEWTQKNLDGTVLFSGKYEMGVPVGEHEYFYDNGKLESKGKYEGGEKNGDWKYYDEEGVLLQVITYSNNELIKVNGKKIMK